jgi:hypothetical protein
MNTPHRPNTTSRWCGPLCSWSGCVGCVRKGHMEYAAGRELRGLARVASARKNTEVY